MLILLLGAALAALLYYYVVKPMKYWKDRGVEQGNPHWIFGHFWGLFVLKENGPEILEKVYNQSPNARYTGMYRFATPVLMLRDPELIKQITIKDFDSFMDHSQFIPPEADLLWSKNLINLTGSKWKDMRMHLSPSFTSSKMRVLFGLMTECAENFIQHLLNKNQDVVTVEMRDLISRYTNDVIATTAFGVKVDSVTQPDNEFYKMGNEVASFSTLWKTMMVVLYWSIPGIKNFIKIRFISDEVGTYFRQIMDETVKAREENGIVRPDLVQLLVEARKKVLKQNDNESDTRKSSVLAEDLGNENLTAHALVFFVGGFESVSSFISFTAYELAINPDIQEKLRKEVRDTLQECEGKVSFEALSNMKYMDMVTTESLRKWPHFISMDRICTKSYTVQPTTPEEKPVHLNQGTLLTIPVYSIQRDPKYYPDPERFDPERFSEENKGTVNPYTYLAFGAGPRNCIGSRFAVLEAKIVLFYLLSKFEIVPVEKTAIPLKFHKTTFINLRPVNGFWLGFKRREL